ncbi:endoglucanase 16-like [Zingiber officinale]|uniref:endoglucanase 16-like n=1 Tax=Zingiber officinale TaxID=94328 RepID=UPI001C4B5338|nr:endoglucanase 16-like [Zingiber officinale]
MEKVEEYRKIFLLFLLFSSVPRLVAFDYGEALSKSLLYFEAQRSGRLPHRQRISWRSDSGLTDGLEQRVDLVGGYYDAGDHVKFGLPMAFTATMLAWGAAEYGGAIAAAGEMEHALGAIKWATDYFIKAHTLPNLLWAQVGEGVSDHYCWQRPEDMTTSRQAYRVDAEHPGTEVAAETAAALAAAAVVFRNTNPRYSRLLLHHAQQLFEFGDKYRGRYDESIPAAKSYYPSVSGYGDELLWAAMWLHRATRQAKYLTYAVEKAAELGGAGWAVSEFSWDIKYAGLQILASKLLMEEGRRNLEEKRVEVLEQYRSKAQHYICSCLNMSTADSNVRRTPGGLLFVREWNNMQYVTGAAFLLTVYSDYLTASGELLHCPRGSLGPREILSFVKVQVDYMLGSNPLGMSYMVGFGRKYPKRVHHRAASTISYKKDGSFIGCAQGYDKWFGRRKENPNILIGAIVGGPNAKDRFKDMRENYMQTEACTYNTAPMVGVFAKLHHLKAQSSSSSS